MTRCASFRSWLGGGGRRAAAAGGAAASGDAKLVKLGLESTIERRRVMAIVTGEEEAPSLINWFEVRNFASASFGVADARGVGFASLGWRRRAKYG